MTASQKEMMPLGMIKMLWNSIVVMAAQLCGCTKCHQVVQCKMVKAADFMLLVCVFYHNKNK